MTSSAAPADPEITNMPRGGRNASWLDRRLQTAALEYTDRYDVPDAVKQKVVTAGNRFRRLEPFDQLWRRGRRRGGADCSLSTGSQCLGMEHA